MCVYSTVIMSEEDGRTDCGMTREGGCYVIPWTDFASRLWEKLLTPVSDLGQAMEDERYMRTPRGKED